MCQKIKIKLDKSVKMQQFELNGSGFTKLFEYFVEKKRKDLNFISNFKAVELLHFA